MTALDRGSASRHRHLEVLYARRRARCRSRRPGPHVDPEGEILGVVTKPPPWLASESKCLAASDKSYVQGETTNARSPALAVGRTSVRADQGRGAEQPPAPSNDSSHCKSVVWFLPHPELFGTRPDHKGGPSLL
jgi:hypothetical protein